MDKHELTHLLMNMVFEREKHYPELLDEIKALPVAELTEDEIKIALIASTILRFNNLGGGESVDLAEIINNQLKEASFDLPLSSEFIKSILNLYLIFIMYIVHYMTCLILQQMLLFRVERCQTSIV